MKKIVTHIIKPNPAPKTPLILQIIIKHTFLSFVLQH